MSIKVLPTHLVNKIAAGEVVERPASVVKELVENAIDAGAGRIDIVIEDGGRRLIQVTDNGSGMGPEDLALAFCPHATSKLASEDDLFAIGTLGFRGEALASVASISHARIQARRADDAGGWEIEASGEAVGQVRPCPAAPGTTVTIRDLFFNTPARRKFMRTATTEIGHIAEQLTRLALPHPRVAFTLTHNGREMKNLPATPSTAQRAADLFGQELGEGLLPIIRRGGGKITVAGLVAAPAGARATGKWQYFFLNGRYIRDRLLSHGLREAFRGRIDPNRWPAAMIFIQVPPDEVDVNVHPTKIEVRFQDSQAVHGELLAALKETLARAELNPGVKVAAVAPRPAAAGAGTAAQAGSGIDAEPGYDGPEQLAEERRASLREALADFFKSAPPQPRLDFPDQPPRTWQGSRHMPRVSAAHEAALAAEEARMSPPGLVENRPARTAATAQGEYAARDEHRPPSAGNRADASAQHPPAGEGLADIPRPAGPPAMQVHDSYLVIQTPDGIEIVDQHALHERILYNELRARLADGKLTGQRMLIPATLSVSAAEAATLEQHTDLLARLGIELSQFGPNTMAVQQFPSLLAGRGVSPAEFVREMLDRLAEDETLDSERLIEDALAMMSCKAAVKAGHPLTAQEIDSLLERARTAEKSSACPHGRPTTLRLTLKDLERQFHRT